MVAGIDIGTSFSSICVLNKAGEVQEIQVSNGLSMIGDAYSLPSAIYVNENNEILVGQAAVQVRFKNPANYKDEFKIDLGESDAYQLGNLSLYPEDLYKEIYGYLKARAERAMDDKIEKAYITYPVTFSKVKKDLIREAAQNSGLLNVELIEEPVAAAMCYCAKENLPNDCKLLIYDFGGGTFDATVVQYSGGKFEVCGRPTGLEDCGGSNVDEIIRFDILSNTDKQTLSDIESNSNLKLYFYSMVSEAAVRVKHLLSDMQECTEIIPLVPNAIEYGIKRSDFEKKIHGLVEETKECMLSAIKQANLEVKDIDMVILVGGSSQIPLVQKMLADTFGKSKIKNNVNYKLAVCTGAALFGKEKKSAQPATENTYESSTKKDQDTPETTVTTCPRAKIQVEDQNTYLGKPACIVVEDTCKLPNRGMVITGFVQNATIYVNDTVTIATKTNILKRNVKIAGIECSRKLINAAEPGLAVGLLLEGINEKDIYIDCVLIVENKNTLAGVDTQNEDITGSLNQGKGKNVFNFQEISSGEKDIFKLR